MLLCFGFIRTVGGVSGSKGEDTVCKIEKIKEEDYKYRYDTSLFKCNDKGLKKSKSRVN